MILAVDIIAQREVAGTGVFTDEVLRAYVPLLGSTDTLIVFGVPGGDASPLFGAFAGSRFRFVSVGWGQGAVARVIAQQVCLPFLLWYYKVDCAYSPSPFFAWCALVPRVVTVHDAAYGLYREYRGWFSQCYIRLSLWLARVLALRVVTVSQSAAADIIRVYGFLPSHVSVITEAAPSLLPVVSNTGESLPAGPYLLYVGSGLGRKNLVRLLLAWQSIAAAWPQHSLVIAGAVHPSALEVAPVVYAQQVIFLGVVTSAYKEQLYRHAVALVYPSLYEGFGLPVLEAQVRQVPVVTSAIPALQETAADSVLYVDPYSVSSIAAGLSRILADSELRADLVARGIRNNQRFNWSTTALQLQRIITDAYAHSAAE
jgi:glycosyltransferase involved in cell wall biosynthesis